MTYAVRADGQGWRTIASADDLAPGEVLSLCQPKSCAQVARPIDQIRAIEARPEVIDALTSVTRKNAIADRLAEASENMPEEKAHAKLMAEDKFYAVLVNAEAEIAELRGVA